MILICISNVSLATSKESHKLQQRPEASVVGNLQPIIGDNLISVLLTDLINIFIHPSWAALLSMFIDLSAFIILPFAGGII